MISYLRKNKANYFKEVIIIPLVTTNEMFEKSMKEHFAIGAFNINNMELIQAIVDAADEAKSPVILQVSPSAIKYARINYLMKMVEILKHVKCVWMRVSHQ